MLQNVLGLFYLATTLYLANGLVILLKYEWTGRGKENCTIVYKFNFGLFYDLSDY